MKNKTGRSHKTSCLQPVCKLGVFIALLFILPGFTLYAADSSSVDLSPAAPLSEGTVYYIRCIDFDITGQSRPFALLTTGELREGERITGQKNLEKYIQQKKQLLLNQRVLESVEIQYELGESEEDGTVPVDLLIITKDTGNILVLPYPKFDSNSGWELTLKARDYNFLGTMTPLRFDIGFRQYENQAGERKNSFNLAIDSDTPFKAFGFNWNFNFDHDFEWRPDEDSGHQFYYKNTTGISMELPVKFTTATFGFEEAIIVNDANTGNSSYDQGRDRKYENYASSELFVSWKIPTPLAVGPFGYLTYTPKLSGNISYGLGEKTGYLHEGLQLSLSHSLNFGRINWIQNYRSGLDASISNGNTYNFSHTNWDISLAASAVGHLPVASFFGISGRLQYRQWRGSNADPDRKDAPNIAINPNADPPVHTLDLYPNSNEVGDVLRGIPDKDLKADWMLSLNMDFPFQVLRFRPSEWFHKSWMRFFNFDLHLSPIVDIALRSYRDTISFEASGGIEAVVFLLSFRSIYVRASLGYDLKELFKSGNFGNPEFFFGIGHHY